MTARRVVQRLAALLRKGRMDRELEGDIAAHLELAEREGLARGLTAAEAHREAIRRFGGIEQVKEEHRDRRSFRWMETLVRDLRYGLASVRRTPGFSAIAVGVLALGIGANVAMFSVVDAVLLKPLPFRDPDRIVRVWEAPRPGVTNATSTLDYMDWRRLGTMFEAMTAEIPVSVTLTGKGDATRLNGKAVTADYFRVFNTTPLLGRTFGAGEDQPDAGRVAVLTFSTWQSYFGGDPEILSRRVTLDGEPHQVVGVLPAGAFDRDVEFFKPLVFTPDQFLRETHWLTVHGRLREGAGLPQAREQLRSVQAAVSAPAAASRPTWTIMVEPLGKLLVGNPLQRAIYVVFGAVIFVLLIACANVANLLLAKGAARRKELAVRAALGASRGRLAAQLLTESLVLCLLGGAAGLGAGLLLIRAATPLLERSLPYTAILAMDYRVLGFATLVALGVGLLVGALPALQTSVGNLGNALQQAARGSSGAHQRMRRTIVIAEVAVSLVLVCGAMLLFKSLANLQELDTGVRIENVITMSFNLPAQGYPTTGSAAAFYESLGQRVNAVPGVMQAALSTHLPLRWIGNGEGIEVTGVEYPMNVRFKRVDGAYFATLGIPVVAGRGLTVADRAGARRVIVINQALAGKLKDATGIQSAVGQVVRLYCPRYIRSGADTESVEIVGVIRSERVAGPGQPDPPVVYVPLAQVPAPGIKVLVRTRTQPASVISGIREAVRQIDSSLPLGDIATMQEVRERTLSGISQPAWLIGVFAGIAALLAAFGLYGVLSQTVTQRRREIGIRVALGARPRDVVSQVLRSALALVAVGLALGMIGTVALSRVLTSLLFGVSPLDPGALTIACGLMTATGLLAGFVPASRAARVDCVTTLRDEG